MAHPAYQPARGTITMVVILCLIAVAAQIGMVPVLGPGRYHGWRIAALALPSVTMFIVGGLTLGSLHRRRMRGIAERLRTMGFEASMEPKAEERSRFWRQLAPLQRALDLRNGSEGLQWLAVKESDINADEYVWLFEYRFVTGSGKAARLHQRTIAVWAGALTPPQPPPTPPSFPQPSSAVRLPQFVMSRLSWLDRRAVKSAELFMPEHAELAKTWAIFGNSATGMWFLTPAVQAELECSPTGESWYLGQSWSACLFEHFTDAENLVRFYERAKRVLRR